MIKILCVFGTRSEAIKFAPIIQELKIFCYVNLMNKSYIILTDLVGIQEESPALSKPVLVRRQEIERNEAIETGVAMPICCTEKDLIVPNT